VTAQYLAAGVLAMATNLAAGGALAADRTLTHGLHAVPAPGKVVIDGDLGEWDRSGAVISCKDPDSLLEVESARAHAMWDDRNLYIGIEWRDAAPMQNNVDPETMAGNGWRSDCVQLRCDMAGFVSHVDCWYYTPGSRAAMSIQYGRFGVEGGGQPKVDRPLNPEKLGAEQAFRLSGDGKGYVQEIKLPWAALTLDGKMPPKGADLRLALELFWGDVTADGWPRSRIADNLMEGETETDFLWTNTKAWGRLFLEEKGNLDLPAPAWTRSKREEPRGPVPIEFELARDGFVTIAVEDEGGSRVCSLAGGARFPAGRHTVWWSGLDDRNSPLPAGTYRWKGITRDAIDLRWKMSFYQPNRACPWQNSRGTGAWGPDHGNLLAAAAGAGRVFLGGLGAEAGFPLFATDEEGAKVWTAKCGEPDRLAFAGGILYAYTTKGDSNWLGITPRGIMRFEAASGRWLDIKGPDGKPTRRMPLLPEGDIASGFAADDEAVYLSVEGKPKVISFDRETFARLREYDASPAGGLFAPGGGALLVLARDALLRLDTRLGKLTTLVSADFSAARALCADARGGTVYVAMGDPVHQVHVYRLSGRSARKTDEIGRPGGRTLDGWYDPGEGFRNPAGLTVDSQGRLWVVEDSQHPKRVRVWQGRRCLRDFIGDTGYGGGGVIDPLDPTTAFYRDMVFKIDLETGLWALKQVGLAMPEGAAEHGVARPEGDRATGSDVEAEYATSYKGRTYVCTCRGERQMFRKRPDGRWALCVYIDPRRKLGWCDRNDDGRVQEGEVFRGGLQADWGGTDYWGMRPSRGLDWHFSRGVDRPGLRLRLAGVSPGGTPLYDFAKFETMAGECMNGIGLADGSYNSGCAGERGEYFSEMRRIRPAGDGKKTYWFRGERTGRWTSRMPAPGIVLYPFQAHGLAEAPSIGGEVVLWVSDFGQRYLFTDDMLYVDQLFADARSLCDGWPETPERGFLANRMAPGQESFHGYFTRLADGRYILTTGFTDCRVIEVTGLDSLRRISGQVKLGPEHLTRAEEIRRFRLSGGGAKGALGVPRAAGQIVLGGDLAAWPQRGAARIDVDAERGAEVLACYDDRNLYVAWDVRDPSPLLNRSQRPELAFKGGDAVDVMLRPPGAALDAPGPREGDTRLLVTELDGKAVAVLYRPVSRTASPYLFDAFEGANRPNAVRMDEVRVAREVSVRTRKSATGYVVEAAIPWALLGFAPRAGLEGRIDFGVLFGDPQGSQTVLRTYWENRDTNIVSDIPSEAQLRPDLWGAFVLGRE